MTNTKDDKFYFDPNFVQKNLTASQVACINFHEQLHREVHDKLKKNRKMYSAMFLSDEEADRRINLVLKALTGE